MPSFRIHEREAGHSLLRILRSKLRLPQHTIQHLVGSGKVHIGRRPCTDPMRRLRSGQQVIVHLPPKRKPDRTTEPPQKSRVKHAIAIRYVDAHIVVVDKPTGLTTVRHASEMEEFGGRAKRFLPPTLVDLVPPLLEGKAGRLRAVHRLDRDTSGLVVLARTAEAERHLGLQFRAHSIERKYLAVVRGKAKSERIESCLVKDRGDGRRGTPPAPPSKGGETSFPPPYEGGVPSFSPPLEGGAGGVGQRAVTHVRVVEDLGDFTLVECRLETGRTHQVRIHLGEADTPLCGERVYDRPLHGRPLPDASGFERPALHAAELAITHPITGKWMNWTSAMPKDMRELLARLKAKQRSLEKEK